MVVVELATVFALRFVAEFTESYAHAPRFEVLIRVRGESVLAHELGLELSDFLFWVQTVFYEHFVRALG